MKCFKKLFLLLVAAMAVNSAAFTNSERAYAASINAKYSISLPQQANLISLKASDENTQTDPALTLEKEVLSASSVKLTWNCDSSFKGAYILYRRKKDTDYTIVGGLYATGESSYTITDNNVLAGTEYIYMVVSISSDGLDDVMAGESSKFSSENNGETTVKWHAPEDEYADAYLVFADKMLIHATDAASSAMSFTYKYPYNYEKRTGKPDFDVYAILKGENYLKKSNFVSVQTTLSSTEITKTSVVGNKTARIDWKKSQGATGYILYRRTSANQSWKKIATVTGTNQSYCYDDAVAAKKNYYYAVKAFVKVDDGTAYSSMSKEKKVYFKKVTKAVKKGDFKKGSVYGPALNTKQLSQVKSAVKKFCDNYITSDMSDLEKVMAAQLYMGGTCKYAASWAKHGANTAWGSLVYKNSKGKHEAQCSGFARGFKALCDGMGIKCRYVHANSKSFNPEHQWNEVRLGGKWYIVDPQASATSGSLVCFLCSGKSYTKTTGMKWNKKSYPALSSKDYSMKKIGAAYDGYKIQRIYKKIFK